jgi:hypothetical protein
VEFTTSDHPSVMTQHAYPLSPLPVSVLHFLTPLTMDRAGFLSQWSAVTVPEVMDTFSSPKASGATADALGALLASRFKMGPVVELCSRNESMQLLTLACSLETGTLSPQGKQLRVGALVSNTHTHRDATCTCRRHHTGHTTDHAHLKPCD